ncbi:hypothetical protein DVH24_010208 [Malus domestica]|uniref:EF-hand domain-containing protein n=1 Tax=Malus domestica TaxID=3750 RepID=A0A498JVA9_MALDO|nr:hypothetical protein DVH24_010208 [Malus domestica]
MASTQNQSANVDLFDAYFRRADLDRDGRISGNEAVAFFQGSGFPNRSLRSLIVVEVVNVSSGCLNSLITNSEPFSAIEHRLEDLLSVTVPVSVSISEPSIQSEISISHRSLALDVLSAEAPLEDIPFAVGESTSVFPITFLLVCPDVIHEDNPTAPSSGSTIR